jgi:transposase-like protein
MRINPPKMPKRLVALDEACVKVNGLSTGPTQPWTLMGRGTVEVLSMRVFPSRNALATKLFVEYVLKYCDGKSTFIVDGAPWLRGKSSRSSASNTTWSPFGDRSLIESVYSSFKRRARAFFNNITSNPLNRSERFRRSMLCWELFIKLFMLYYNHLRRWA